MSENWVDNYINKYPKSQDLYKKALNNTAGGVGHDLRYTLPFPRYISEENGSEGVKLEQQLLVAETGTELLSQFPFEEALME